ncbi:fibroblast growth factor 5 [Sceloporus undulatus]|uniref:fibroblast growth factor 5 n=1 Tax=Sceloporus undulatus TaxID=8520 RepID=UPI001C4BBB47|nr:fibroblast growth factor 5 [Sceloporus undulatus]
MSLSSSLCLLLLLLFFFLSHRILWALAHQEQQLGGDPGLRLRHSSSSRRLGRKESTSGTSSSSSSSSVSALSAASYSGPSGEVPASALERSSFQWSPSGRRTGSLYCRVGIGFHLQIHPDGHVNGSHQGSLLSHIYR